MYSSSLHLKPFSEPGPSRATAGPGKTLLRGPITPPHSVCLDIESEETWGEVPLSIRLGIRGNVVSSPSGVSKNEFYAYFRSERSHLEHHFHYLERRWGPQKLRGPGKLPPPLSTGLLIATGCHLPYGIWQAKPKLLNNIVYNSNRSVFQHC